MTNSLQLHSKCTIRSNYVFFKKIPFDFCQLYKKNFDNYKIIMSFRCKYLVFFQQNITSVCNIDDYIIEKKIVMMYLDDNVARNIYKRCLQN